MIQVEQLVKRYRGAQRNAVDGTSFEVGAGEFFALLGPNGAGKTTTISILTTTLAPSGGRATIDGLDIVREASAVRRRVGIIFQRPSLDRNLTGEENVRFHAVLYGVYPYAPLYRLMPSEYREEVTRLAGIVGLGDEIFAPIKTYSGGMARKLEIVRSLVHRPKVLFLDEPSAGLDPPSRRSLWSYLREVRRETKTTILLTTHYLEEAEDADRICVMDRGKVVSYGTPAEIKADLVEEFLVVDSAATDRVKLQAELDRLRLRHGGSGPIRIELDGRRTHAVLKSIDTPLTVVETHTPTLEDAYLEIVRRGEEAEGAPASDGSAKEEQSQPQEAVRA
jgi:ABC-2 type transport system ATP-binding protein